MLKNATAISRMARSAQISATSRAFAASALNTQATRPNTAGVDPRVLDGQVLLPKANMDRLCEWQSGLWERLAKEVRSAYTLPWSTLEEFFRKVLPGEGGAKWMIRLKGKGKRYNPALLDVKQKWDKEGLDIIHLLDKSARDPALGLAFNYASLLLNNSFFLEGMTAEESAMPESCGGEAQAKVLVDKLEAYAEGIVGGGWLWLVRVGNSSSNLDIIPTFASGTLLVSQRYQLGRDDDPLFLAPNTATPITETAEPPSSPSANANANASDAPLNQATTGELSKQVKTKQRAYRSPESATDSNSKITPLAVLNLYETAWLGEKYGVWSKGRYAADWFRTLDWSRLIKKGQ